MITKKNKRIHPSYEKQSFDRITLSVLNSQLAQKTFKSGTVHRDDDMIIIEHIDKHGNEQTFMHNELEGSVVIKVVPNEA